MDLNATSTLNRREFLRRSATGLAGLTLAGSLPGCGTPRPAKCAATQKISVGLQLYSLRNECKTDFPGTLAAVAQMGYREVEFAGYWGRTAPEVRKMLDDLGLATCGTHTAMADLQPATIAATIEFNRIIGNPRIICPYLTGKTREEWRAHARFFDDLAARLKPLGMQTGYHAHKHDFTLVDGESAWDIFFRNTNPEVIMQLDTSNCRDGGKDPVAVLHQYPGRARSVHIKPNGAGPEAILGEDQIHWPGVFEWCETKGGTEVYVVEHESSSQPLETVKRTLAKLKELGRA
jgi:sugar phosphate isomerase/epimerase